MMRALLPLLALFCAAQPLQSGPAASDSRSRLLSPPSGSRILKIIHSWPDDPAAQDHLVKSLTGQGFGGVVCNVSFTDYLQSDLKWTAFIRAVEKARAAGFALWLYDEKGYPSATAGGLVLRGKPEWEARGLLVSDLEVETGPVEFDMPPGLPRLVAAFPVVEKGVRIEAMTNLVAHTRAAKLSWNPPPGRWRVLAITEDRLFEGTHASMSLSEHIPYPNLLDPNPTARFIELTHGEYSRRLDNRLGNYFVSTFTDEPSLMSLFLRPMPYRVLPWSTNLAAAFQAGHGYRIEDNLPALVLDAGPQTARVRYDYWNTVGTLVAENFFGQIQDWCRKHHVLSGGHLLMEENLVNHVPLYGDFFRCLRRLDAPGIDCLTSIPEQVPWFIARLAGSAAELEGRSVTMCETSDHSQRYRPPGDSRPITRVSEQQIRGTCNRLIVSGIDTITSYYSFDGLNSEQLSRLNHYVGRCCSALTGGHQVAGVAVLYPVESVWTRFTPARHYANDSPGAAKIEALWRDVSETLFSAGREFTFVDGRALAEAKVDHGSLVHGQLRWTVVVLPGADTLPLKAWQNLSDFVQTGGVLLGIGALPANSETEFPSPAVKQLAARLLPHKTDSPGVVRHQGGGCGIFLPAGLACLASEVVNQVLPPDLDFGGGVTPLRYTHRRIDGNEIFFVINDGKEPWRGNVSLSVEGPGEQWNPADGSSVLLASGRNQDLALEPYGGTIYSFSKAVPLKPHTGADLLPDFAISELLPLEPSVARGEFVRERLTTFKPQPNGPSSEVSSPFWQAAASLTRGQVDTYLFLRFQYKASLDLRDARALVLDSWVPEKQVAPAQLLAILHEKSGADYLAQSGRLLNAPGLERSWIALERFQLAGWSQDANARLDLGEVSEIRVGWGGYLGKEGEQVTFAVGRPAVARAKLKATSSRKQADHADLRPGFERFGLASRRQGGRPTCSVFTVASALEFAIAQRDGHTPRLSIEFLNWAANDVCGDAADGGFFSDLWRGFEKYGICTETAMTYRAAYDAKSCPSPEALAEARTRLELGLRLNWIKAWNVNTGLSDPEFAAVKSVLQQGWPVCGGFRWPVKEEWTADVLQLCPANAVRDGHSVLLVGFKDDPQQPGGGVFVFRNTGGQGRDGFMPYAYAREFMNDAVWIDHSEAPRP